MAAVAGVVAGAGTGAGAGAATAGAGVAGSASVGGVTAGGVAGSAGAAGAGAAGASAGAGSSAFGGWSSTAAIQGGLAAYNKFMQIGTAYMAYKDAISYSKRLVEQGVTILEDARRESANAIVAANSFAAKQKVDYLSSGVDIGGSPAAVIQQTKKYGEAESAAILKKGETIARQYRESAEQAQKTAKRGLISSFF